jgi:hypothetical protein
MSSLVLHPPCALVHRWGRGTLAAPAVRHTCGFAPTACASTQPAAQPRACGPRVPRLVVDGWLSTFGRWWSTRVPGRCSHGPRQSRSTKCEIKLPCQEHLPCQDHPLVLGASSRASYDWSRIAAAGGGVERLVKVLCLVLVISDNA